MIMIIAAGVGVTATVIAPITFSTHQGPAYPQPGASPHGGCSMLCDAPSTVGTQQGWSGPSFDATPSTWTEPYGGGSGSTGQWTIDFTASGQLTVTPPGASTYSPGQSGCVLLCDTASGPSTVSPAQGGGQAPFGVTTPSR